jgi:hypothetical protein
LQSQFAATWSTINVTKTTGQSSPDGGTNAVKITATSSTNPGVNENSLTFSAVVTTFSAYAKAGASNYVLMIPYDGSSHGTYFNVAQCTVDSTSAGNSNAVVPMANGWCRIIVTRTVASTSTGSLSFYIPNNSLGGNVGTIGNSAYLFGAQVEQNATYPNPYIPTTTVSVTRPADVVTLTGALATALSGSAGTVIVSTGGMNPPQGTASTVVDSNGTDLLGYNTSGEAETAVGASLATATMGLASSPNTIGLSWNASGGAISMNGGTVATDATARTPSATLGLGSSGGSSNFINGNVTRLTVF